MVAETAVEIAVEGIAVAVAAAGVLEIVAAESGLAETVAAFGGGGMAVAAGEGVIDAAGLWGIVWVERLEVVAVATWESAALERRPDVEAARGVGGG